MQINPEDNDNKGPHCRNCHRGSSDCATCHTPWGSNGPQGYSEGVHTGDPNGDQAKWFYAYTSSIVDAAEYDGPLLSPVNPFGHRRALSTAYTNAQWRSPRTFATNWPTDWDTTSVGVNAVCSNDGFSWPHRTMGWKMLKDELWGLDRDGTVVSVGEQKTVFWQAETTDPVQATQTTSIAAHDLDSVCLECHNPNVWRASSYSSYSQANGPYDDQLLLRGLP